MSRCVDVLSSDARTDEDSPTSPLALDLSSSEDEADVEDFEAWAASLDLLEETLSVSF